LALLDISANTLLTIGMFLIGSGLYQVVYSSIVVFIAVLSTLQFVARDELGKHQSGRSVRWNPAVLNGWQWVGVV
ncbi:hypothetical protein HDU93_006899, partial [Gonapodya sp. JEL0774]